MPDRAEHLAKATANRRFLQRIVEQRLAPDWAVTVLFYQAMHAVEAWFANRSVHHLNHVRRNQAVFDHLREIATPYRKLHDLSRIARYSKDGLVTWADYEDSVIAFAEIESHIESHLDQ